MKTLNEVSSLVGMSRRIIQEYEKAGLATTPTTTNKYGHLLYDDEAVERLWQIRFYRELGYKKIEIKQVLCDPNYNKHETIMKQIELLEEKKAKLESLIDTAKALNELDLSPSILQYRLPGMEEVSYDTAVSLIGAAVNIVQLGEDTEQSLVSVLSEEDEDHWFEAIDKIMEFFHQEILHNADIVQKQVEIMHKISAKEFSESILMFSWSNLSYAPGNKFSEELDQFYGAGSAAFLFDAIRYYCMVREGNPLDHAFTDALQTIEKLGRKKHTTSSEEVQREVQKIHQFFSAMPALTEAMQLQSLENMSQQFASKAYKELIDNGQERGISWFILRAIKIYCDNFKRMEGYNEQ